MFNKLILRLCVPPSLRSDSCFSLSSIRADKFPWLSLVVWQGTLVFEGKYITRKNNSRWTAKEVELLVQGVSKFGVGRWTELKKKYFKTSIRTSVNLKVQWISDTLHNAVNSFRCYWLISDSCFVSSFMVQDKWRNLLRAYQVRVSSNKHAIFHLKL